MCKPTVLKLLSLHFQYSAQKLSRSGHLFRFETNSECLKAAAGFPGLLRAGTVSRAGQGRWPRGEVALCGPSSRGSGVGGARGCRPPSGSCLRRTAERPALRGPVVKGQAVRQRLPPRLQHAGCVRAWRAWGCRPALHGMPTHCVPCGLSGLAAGAGTPAPVWVLRPSVGAPARVWVHGPAPGCPLGRSPAVLSD